MEKNKKMMVVIIGLLVLLLGVIVGVSVFAFNMIKKGGSGDKQEIVYTDIETELFELGESVNANLLAGPDGREHVASVNISVAVNVTDKDGAAMLQKLNNSEAIIRDAVISILRDKTYEELKHKDSEDIVREEILTRLQDQFRTNLIVGIYFSVYSYA